MSERPDRTSRGREWWLDLFLRPLAADDAAAKFWARHVRVGTALSVVTAFVVLAYVVLADRPHLRVFFVIALVVVVTSPLLLLLPLRTWMASRRGPALFYLWSLALTLVIMAIALLDGGTESPLLWLLILPTTFAALAYPPLGVILAGALTVGASLLVAVIDGSVGTDPLMIAAVLCLFTAMTAWMARNHWDNYEQQRLLTARHAELNRAQEEFIATTSHEVRTPVASIMGYLELLEDGETEPELAAKFLTTIRRNAERLKDLSEDLLVLSRWETEQRRGDSQELTLADVDLVDVARLVGETLAPLAARQEVSLDVDVPRLPLVVAGSAEQLERAVLNLVSNAVKYTPAGGAVVCTVSGSADEAMVLVRDTGIGIAEDELKGLFTRFFRASNARARAIAGVGLGLNIAHEIISAHGGRVSVTSRLGEGTTFVVNLPRVGPLVDAPTTAPPASTRASKPARPMLVSKPPDAVGAN